MGDRITGTAGDENQNVAQGKDIQQVSVYTDRIEWRNAAQQEFANLHRQIDTLKGWMVGLMITICILFLLGFIISAFAIRQFDIHYDWMQYNSRRLDAIERREQWRIPGSIPPDGTP